MGVKELVNIKPWLNNCLTPATFHTRPSLLVSIDWEHGTGLTKTLNKNENGKESNLIPGFFPLKKQNALRNKVITRRERILFACFLTCLCKPKSSHMLNGLGKPANKTQQNPKAFQVVKLYKNCHDSW